MKLKVSSDILSKSLATVSRPVLSKANLPILSNLMIVAKKGSLEMLSTNLETATKVVVECKVEVEGKTTVGARNFFEFISQLGEGEVEIEKLGEELVVWGQDVSARFATMAVEEFPAIPKIEKGLSLDLPKKNFIEATERVSFCAAQDEGRPILTGVLCEFSKTKMAMVATDGYRLSYGEVKTQSSLAGVKIVIPARALLELSKILGERGGETFKMTISSDLNQVNFEVEGVEFTSRLIEGEFPNWQKTIPSSFSTRATISKEELTRLVKIASVFARDSGNIVRLKLDSSGKKPALSVVANAREVGSTDAKSNIEMSGPGGEIAFNFRYVLEALGAINNDEIHIEMIESLNPGKFSGGDGKDFFQIIMPVRLQG